MVKRKIFDPIEMELRDVPDDMTPDELLAEDGIYLMNPVCKKLGIDSADLRKKAKEMLSEGKSAWQEMGVRKILSVWVIRMKNFAPYFESDKFFKILKVNNKWDGNELLTKKGLFYLTDVCRKIPFTPHQFRHQVRQNPKSRKEYGVWWDDDLKHYLVDMEIFAKWVTDLWLNRKQGF
ncbi:MAG: hypothetical protein KDC35_16125 [Acidobacteria bacterium]|nr:hypothetical protein [Acidobacteriota bacterium]